MVHPHTGPTSAPAPPHARASRPVGVPSPPPENGDRPNWLLVPPRKPGTRAETRPMGTIRKGARELALNEAAVRLLAGVGDKIPPPAQLYVRVFVDREKRLLGLSVTEKDDGCGRTLHRERKGKGENQWAVGIRFVLEADGELLVKRTLRAPISSYGNRVFGLSFADDGAQELRGQEEQEG